MQVIIYLKATEFSVHVLLTFGGFTVSDHVRAHFIPRNQELSLCIFPAHSFKEPAESHTQHTAVQRYVIKLETNATGNIHVNMNLSGWWWW